MDDILREVREKLTHEILYIQDYSKDCMKLTLLFYKDLVVKMVDEYGEYLVAVSGYVMELYNRLRRVNALTSEDIDILIKAKKINDEIESLRRYVFVELFNLARLGADTIRIFIDQIYDVVLDNVFYLFGNTRLQLLILAMNEPGVGLPLFMVENLQLGLRDVVEEFAKLFNSLTGDGVIGDHIRRVYDLRRFRASESDVERFVKDIKKMRNISLEEFVIEKTSNNRVMMLIGLVIFQQFDHDCGLILDNLLYYLSLAGQRGRATV